VIGRICGVVERAFDHGEPGTCHHAEQAQPDPASKTSSLPFTVSRAPSASVPASRA
jgi:hypothetical protein